MSTMHHVDDLGRPCKVCQDEVVRAKRVIDVRYLMPVVDRNEIARQVGELRQECVELGIDTIEGCKLKPGQKK